MVNNAACGRERGRCAVVVPREQADAAHVLVAPHCPWFTLPASIVPCGHCAPTPASGGGGAAAPPHGGPAQAQVRRAATAAGARPAAPRGPPPERRHSTARRELAARKRRQRPANSVAVHGA